MPQHTSVRIKAFTLIELSITLVIIGLLVGGILAGKDMIKTAEINRLIANVNNVTAAVNTFQLKYSCLPGDCATATRFLGTAANCGTSFSDQTGTATCNGNGNGTVENWGLYGNDGPSGSLVPYEQLLFWNHLGGAGFIPGQYHVEGYGYTYVYLLPGRTVPALQGGGSSNVGYQLMYTFGPTSAADANYFIISGHQLFLGSGASYTTFSGGALPVSTEHQMDTKMDDGLPGKGSVTTLKKNAWNGPGGCSSTSNADTAVYSDSYASLCPLFIAMKW